MPKICLITLGCPKNVVESESVAGILIQKGHNLTTDINNCDYALLHTCSFIRDARDESETFIRALSRLKERGKIRKVFVSGCLVQDEGKSVTSLYPDIDGFIGTGELSKIDKLLSGGERFICGKPGGLLESVYPRIISSKGATAYLRISEGCSHKCSFCHIPKLRGRYISRKIGSIVREAGNLSQIGIKELVLIAEDTTSYGRDIYGKYALPLLIKKLSLISGIKWIRLLYAYPASITDELLNLFNKSEKLCRYIDVPIQHASDNVLKKMGRPLGARKLVEKIKKTVPGIQIRTSLIAGFPGESKNDFNELFNFVKEGWFSQLGVFEYSDNPKTVSFNLNGKINAAEKTERKMALMETQKGVVRKNNREFIGKIEEAVVEESKGGRLFAGRTKYQAPEIDGKIILRGNAGIGGFVRAKITGFKGYDLFAKII